MSGARGEGTRGFRYALADVVIATPALVAIAALIVQLIADFGPHAMGYGVTVIGLLVGVALSVVTALVGILRLVISPVARSTLGYIAASLAIVVGLGGAAMFIALVTHR
jgi:hypothetical protein